MKKPHKVSTKAPKGKPMPKAASPKVELGAMRMGVPAEKGKERRK